MKILMISSYLPYPLFSGGQIRLYNLIKELSQEHEITLVCEKRPFQTSKDIDEVKKICKDVITVDREKQWSISNIIKSGFSSHSFLVTGHTLSSFQQKIQELLSQNSFDLIHVETYYVMQNVPETKIPIVLVEHNIEYQVYERFMNRAFFPARPLLKVDIGKIKKEEEYFWKKSNALVAVSHEDQNVMKDAGFNPYLVANGVNIDKFTFKEKSSDKFLAKRLLFIGDFKWIQNQDSAKFIIEEIWSGIKIKLKTQNLEQKIQLWIVGREIPDSIRRLTNDPDVLFDEASSSLPTEKIFHEASFLLAPIRVGGGTSYKILESMSSGTPVVTMQMSADALGATDGQNIMIGKTAEELAEKSLQLLQNEILYKTISKNGRALVEKNYTWKEIGKELEEVYKKTASND